MIISVYIYETHDGCASTEGGAVHMNKKPVKTVKAFIGFLLSVFIVLSGCTVSRTSTMINGITIRISMTDIAAGNTTTAFAIVILMVLAMGGTLYLYNRLEKRNEVILIKAAETAEKANAAKSEFLANMSHVLERTACIIIAASCFNPDILQCRDLD
jgi:hypothetical protein